MTLKNSKIATAKPDAKANKAYIDALFMEAYSRYATVEEQKKFVGQTIRDAANTILGSRLSPFYQGNVIIPPTAIHPLIWPLKKVQITQKFGERPEVYRQFGLNGHDGIDLKTRYLTSPLGNMDVFASHDAIVQEVRHDKNGYGTHIRLYKKGLGMTLYGHLSKALVQVGQTVKQGDTIGVSGNTGFSTAPHLHWEFRPDPLDSANGFAGAVDQTNYLS